MFWITKVRVYAIVNEYGTIVSVDAEPVCKSDQYAVPVTISLGHSWDEGFIAWLMNVRAEIKSFL
jgi:hypothetical protein